MGWSLQRNIPQIRDQSVRPKLADELVPHGTSDGVKPPVCSCALPRETAAGSATAAVGSATAAVGGSPTAAVAVLALLSTGLSLSLSRVDLAAVVVVEPRLLYAKADRASSRFSARPTTSGGEGRGGVGHGCCKRRCRWL
uniref:Uncharacterized protein n=1 Tax=Oryza nivara TaxID=4536 RepID=A0A0E0IA36_ORYNI